MTAPEVLAVHKGEKRMAESKGEEGLDEEVGVNRRASEDSTIIHVTDISTELEARETNFVIRGIKAVAFDSIHQTNRPIYTFK